MGLSEWLESGGLCSAVIPVLHTAGHRIETPRSRHTKERDRTDRSHQRGSGGRAFTHAGVTRGNDQAEQLARVALTLATADPLAVLHSNRGQSPQLYQSAESPIPLS